MKNIVLILCSCFLCFSAYSQSIDKNYTISDYKRILDEGYKELEVLQEQADIAITNNDTTSFKKYQSEIKNLQHNCQIINSHIHISDMNSLLDKQNRLLNQRMISLGITCGGIVVGTIGYVSAANGNQNGNAVGTTGAIIGAVGGIWLIVNEFQLCSVTKKINGHMYLTTSPTGAKLTF